MDSAYGSFYITLPSNASLNVFPQNTLTTYTAQLPDVVELNGDYEVGLAEIHYPHNWNSYHSNSNWRLQIIEITHSRNEGHSEPSEKLKVYHLTLDIQGYVDIKHIIGTCNNKIRETLAGKTFNFPVITWDQNAHCVKINNTYETQVELPVISIVRFIDFSSALREILGFQNYEYVDSKRFPVVHNGNQTVSMRNHFDQIYVYSDICNERYVGDIKASLLRIVPIKGTAGDNISLIYEKPQYIPVVKNRIQTIQILLRTDTGNPIKFINGRVVVTLHFRRRRVPI